jgi:multidrug efflux pump subunit AcrA (membrane-fusion protein)
MPSSPRACRPTPVSAPADASASRRVEVGDHIRADDILAELDRKDLQTAVDNAQAVLGRSCIRLKRLIIMAFVLMPAGPLTDAAVSTGLNSTVSDMLLFAARVAAPGQRQILVLFLPFLENHGTSCR